MITSYYRSGTCFFWDVSEQFNLKEMDGNALYVVFVPPILKIPSGQIDLIVVLLNSPRRDINLYMFKIF